MDIDATGKYAAISDNGAIADNAKSYTIGDLAREFGVTLRTLRFYEDRGLLSPAAREPLVSTTPATATASP
jgi:transposase-like protein